MYRLLTTGINYSCYKIWVQQRKHVGHGGCDVCNSSMTEETLTMVADLFFMKWWKWINEIEGYDQCRGTTHFPWSSRQLCSPLTIHPLEVDDRKTERWTCKQMINKTGRIIKNWEECKQNGWVEKMKMETVQQQAQCIQEKEHCWAAKTNNFTSKWKYTGLN